MSAVRVSGDCWLHFAFDVAAAIDLEQAEESLPRRVASPTVIASRESLSERRRTPPSIQFKPKPLRIVRPHDAIEVGDGGLRTEAEVEITLYDFGAVSVAYRIRFDEMDLEGLRALSTRIAAGSGSLGIRAESVAQFFIIELGDAARGASLAEPVEDYVVFHVERWSGDAHADERSASGEGSASGAPSKASAALPFELPRDGAALAAILRAADEALSDVEVADALGCVIAYGRRDLALIDWNAAIIVEPDPASAADLLAVLEFANVELVELRFLDDRLDAVLDRAYRTLWLGDAEHAGHAGNDAQVKRDDQSPRPERPARGGLGGFSGWSRTARRERRRLAALHMDSALLFEGVNNAIKLLGDQYLARVYRLAAKRFHLAEWDAAILRKIDTLQRLYEKTADEQATRRMEVLEWIIIILIAISIAVMFIPGAK